jgi:hypothetical protein
MANRRLAWTKDVKVFAALVVLNLVLMGLGGLIEDRAVYDVWFWVFTTPSEAARECGWTDFANLLLAFNPLLYGLM